MTKLERGHRWLAGWSREVVEHAHDMAGQSDRWFLSMIAEIEKGAQRAQDGIVLAGRKLLVSLPSLGRQESPKQRMRRLFEREAKKRGLDISSREFERFSERIATVVELVLTGALKVEDIAFEADADRLSEMAPESGPSPPVE